MKRWQETTAVFAALRDLAPTGRRAVLVTLIRIQGSAYRRPGARLLLHEDGRMTGNVSGGCIEDDLRERAQRVLASARPERAVYETGGDEDTVWGFGLGCEGTLEFLLQPVPLPGGPAFVESVLARLRGHEPFALHLRLEEPGAGQVTLHVFDEPAAPGFFADALTPPPDLVVFGAGDDARPLARLAVEQGFRVTVVDHRRAYLDPARWPADLRTVCRRPEDGTEGLPLHARSLAVLMTHHLKRDKAWLEHLLPLPLLYLGLLGPPRRRDQLLQGADPSQHPHLHAPIGLDLGAEGPEQIALSIVAELLAVAHGRTGGLLRDRTAALHG